MCTFPQQIRLHSASGNSTEEPGALAVIGAHTLKGFLLGVDPVGQRLVPVEGYSL